MPLRINIAVIAKLVVSWQSKAAWIIDDNAAEQGCRDSAWLNEMSNYCMRPIELIVAALLLL